MSEGRTHTMLADRRADRRTVIEPTKRLFDLDLPEVWRYRELMGYLMWRDLKVRFSQAALGTAWAVLQPMIAVAIFTVVFGLFARIPSNGLPYVLFAFSGMLPWTLFSEASRRSALGLLGDAELVKKVYFPRLVIPLANTLSPVADFMAALPVFLALMAWYGHWPSWSILALPLFVLLAMLMGFAFGLWLGPINVRFHDVMHTLPFLMQVWMYATPIIYPLSMVPERYQTLYSLNPTVGLIEGFRWCLLGQGPLDPFALTVTVMTTTLALAGGVIFFRHSERRFADVI